MVRSWEGGRPVIGDWVLLLVSVAYVGLLFAVAYFGDRRPLYPNRVWLRPIVYSLALAVYCSSWTFYGAVGSAISSGWGYFAIYLGPILLFVFGPRLVERLVLIAKDQNITSIGDFIASRFGKSQALAVAVALIALTAAVPYLALQFKAVAMSIQVLSGAPANGGAAPAVLADAAFWVAALLALFAILFGTRQIDATEHHHGMMLAIALESLVKLLAFAAVGLYALWLLLAPSAAGVLPAVSDSLPLQRMEWPAAFLAQTLLAFCAMVCLPRQFQVGVVECEDASDIRRARWWFPIYLLIFSALVPPIALAAWPLLQGSGLSADAAVLWLPLSQGQNGLALLAYIGGFSAATGMVIVASVALSIMISNDLVMPLLVRLRKLHLDSTGDLSRVVLWVRRFAIVGLATLGYVYYRITAQSDSLAATGLLAFVAVAQFMPAMLAGLYWSGASRHGVMAGLVGGFVVWIYTLLLPTVARAGWLADDWLASGPFDLGLLRPEALFGLSGWHPITHGVFWSLSFNVLTMVLVSLRYRVSLSERLQAARFLDPYRQQPSGSPDRAVGQLTVGDLRELATRILGERFVRRAFDEYLAERETPLRSDDRPDRALLQYTERLLAGALGAATARHVMAGALSGSGLDLAQVVDLLDTASQELRFSRELLTVTFEHMAQGISVVDDRMRLVAWNRRYMELFDYPDRAVHLGTPIATLIALNAERGLLGPGSVDDHVDKRLAHMRQGSAHIHVREWPDGRVIESRGEPLPGGGYLMTFADITEYKRTEQALRESNETLELRVSERTRALSRSLDAEARAKREAEAANLSKTRFLAAASHDLLQPLNAARLFTSALREHPVQDDEIGRLSERIDTSLRAAEELLDGLLDISRLDTGRLRPQMVDLAAGDLMLSLREQFSALAATRGIELRIRSCSAGVHSDRRLLRRVLQNLIANALRYTAAGRVLAGCRRRRDCLEFQVLDTGPGIPPEHQERIFDEFRRLDSDSPWGEQGLGLGLSICQRISRLLGATLTVRSIPDRGSQFIVRVPYAHGPVVGAERTGSPVSPGSLAGMLVLCLDNDRAILDGMQTLLRRWDAEPMLACRVDEALALCRERRPDALLVDFHLHDRCDGIAALRELQACWPENPPQGGLVTADTSDALAARARDEGVAIMRKPLKPAVLRAQLSAIWSRPRGRRRS